MQKPFLFIALLLSGLVSNSQKKLIDTTVYGKWLGSDKSSFSNSIVSNDGKYIVYYIGSRLEGFSMYVREINGVWQKEVKGVRFATLAAEDHILIYKTPAGRLTLLTLATKREEIIDDVESYKVSILDSGQWMSYRLKDHSLNVRNLINGQRSHFKNVSDYYIYPSGSSLILQTIIYKEQPAFVLIRVRFTDFLLDTLLQSSSGISNLTFDESGHQMAFYAKSENDTTGHYRIMYLTDQMAKPSILIEQTTSGLPADVSLQEPTTLKFSSDGKKLFFTVSSAQLNPPTANIIESVHVDVWHYRDQNLQTAQLKKAGTGALKMYYGVFRLPENKLCVFTKSTDDPETLKFSNGRKGDYALIFSAVNQSESFWNNQNRPDIYLLSLKDATRHVLQKSSFAIELFDISFSPGGNYVFWYDRQARDYFTYNIHTRQTRKISDKISTSIFAENSFPSFPLPFGVGAWSAGDSSLFIYDQFDIWQVDADGVKPAVNITKGYGRQHNVRLRFQFTGLPFGEIATIKKRETIVLSVSDVVTMGNAFCPFRLDDNLHFPIRFSLKPYEYTLIWKNETMEKFIVKRSSITEAPNLFVSRDFQDYQSLSVINPQKEFNWMKGELIRWRMLDGKENIGILFKPENFDPHKCYPIIFNFYQYTGPLHYFRYPEPSNGEIDIPSFVSNGYLVFRPAIQFTKGQPGYSAYNSVVSAIRYLSQFSWFDSTKIGLSGISYGGYEINYLITHTTTFAAAAPAAGMSDLISDYNGLWYSESKQWMYEVSQGRMGAPLWERPLAYLSNSPVFRANKVQTPTMILHNKEDENVSWDQGLEWFTALRRLGKSAWLLQYDGERHGLLNIKNKTDFSVRLFQFFDHYLKRAPASIWMTKGIPATMKGKENGIELDPSGNCSKDCKICKQWNEKYQKDAAATMKEIEEKTKTEHWMGGGNK